MIRVFISIGSNLGSRYLNILNSIQIINSKINITIVSQSPIYESNAMYNLNQNRFLNIVLELKTNIRPIKLLSLFKEIEQDMGRKITNIRNQPRIIDIDILDYDKMIYCDRNLTLPHPLIFERLFVLKPWSDISPEFKLPNMNTNIMELMEKIDSSNQIINLYNHS